MSSAGPLSERRQKRRKPKGLAPQTQQKALVLKQDRSLAPPKRDQSEPDMPYETMGQVNWTKYYFKNYDDMVDKFTDYADDLIAGLGGFVAPSVRNRMRHDPNRHEAVALLFRLALDNDIKLQNYLVGFAASKTAFWEHLTANGRTFRP